MNFFPIKVSTYGKVSQSFKSEAEAEAEAEAEG